MHNFLSVYFVLFYFHTSFVVSDHAFVQFNVIPSRFVLNVPFNARCTVGNFNPTGQNFEVTFWVLSAIDSISHPVKLPIGTYLITNTGKKVAFFKFAIFNINISFSGTTLPSENQR